MGLTSGFQHHQVVESIQRNRDIGKLESTRYFIQFPPQIESILRHSVKELRRSVPALGDFREL